MNQKPRSRISTVSGLKTAAVCQSCSLLTFLLVQPSWAEANSSVAKIETKEKQNPPVLHLNQLKFPASTLKGWHAQSFAQVTGVRLNQTAEGLQIILATPTKQLLVPLILPEGNNLVIDILDAVLALPGKQEFTATNPAPGITKVTVKAFDATSIRVTIVGVENAPTAKVIPSQTNLVLRVTPSDVTAETKPDEEIAIVVTGEREEKKYIVPNASTATRTDTPLRDIPQAIQVIPQQLIKDQGVTRIEEALRSAVGVTQQVDRRSPGASFTIRGFSSRGLRNGFDFTLSGPGGGEGNPTAIQLPNNIERVEVLRGPDSVLNGSGEPGGTVNFVTKQPLSEPFYSAEFTAGQFDFFQPAIDLTGPLTDDKKLRYRLTSAYQSFGSFIDFVEGDAVSVAPTLSYNFSDNTTLKIEYEYSFYKQLPDAGLPLDRVIFDLPNSRNFNFTDEKTDLASHTAIASLKHDFNDNISFRIALRAGFTDGRNTGFNIFDFDSEFNEVIGNFFDGPIETSSYSLQNSLTTKFKTGSVQHQLLFGVDWSTSNQTYSSTDFNELSLDVFNPDFDQPFREEETFFLEEDRDTDVVGIYLQDQITLLPNLKLLVGGRYDFSSQETEGFELEFEEQFDFSDEFDDDAFSPRVGIVYQPIEPISLYGNFSRSFLPNNERTSEGELIEPQRGTQFEVGVKTEFAGMTANLAAYQITRTNELRVDPADPDFSIAIGEVRSRGLEFDIGGEILPGWDIVASVFINDTTVTEGDEDNPEGDTFINAPGEGASIWTTYEMQTGYWQGLGFGFGLFYVGDREGELPNDFVLPSFVRADASIFYRRENWDVQLNLKNLFDKEYFEGTTAELTSFGAPFTVSGRVAVQF